MKKYILYILLIFSISVEGRVYQTSDQQVRRIGYTTVGIYDTHIVNTKRDKGINYYGYNLMRSSIYSYQSKTSKPINTYMPSASRPRRITVYDGNGNTAETPGGSGDSEGIYQYDETTGKWYYSPDDGKTWYEWRRAGSIWELFVGLFGGGWGNDWRTVNNPPSENSGRWASDPDDPFLTPVGEIPMGLVLFLIILYITKKYYKYIWKIVNYSTN